MQLSRRSVLGSGIAGLAGFYALPTLQGRPRRGSKQRPKNIIFCVVDGMAMQTLSLADHFRKATEGKPSYWAWLMEQDFAVNGLQATRSLNSVVTDSAAASSSWGSGRHIWNGQINQYPDGTKLRTVASLMIEAKVKVGLVTTTTITHATPSGFAIQIDNRDREGMIAEQYLKSGVDLLMGGGDRFFSAAKRKDKKDLYSDFAKAGYKVAKTRDEIVGAKAGKILGIFSDSHLPFSVDRNNDAELQKSTPTLAEMVTVAIDNLKGAPNGFLLQVEGGKVDHAAHANDAAAMLYDQIAFEEALKIIVDFALEDKETLVVITADHACGGPSLNGAGEEYIDSTAGLLSLAKMKSSYSPLMAAIGTSPTPARIKDVTEDRLGLKLSDEEAQAILSAVQGKSPFGLSEFKKGLTPTLAMVFGNHTKIGFTSGNHTAEHVMLTAIGPGSEFAHGLTENISLFDTLLATKGLKYQNPTMTFEDAKKHYEKLKAQVDPELFATYASVDEDLWHGHRFDDERFWRSDLTLLRRERHTLKLSGSVRASGQMI